MKKFLFAALIAGAMSALSFVAPASAQATRTWVSGTGDDVNPCSRTAPCKTFPGAYSKTATGGEINCIDPGGFGTITISKSITINCAETHAGVLASGTNAITINAGATEVFLEGLDIEGLAAGPNTAGLNGIKVNGGGTVIIRKCSIRNFSQHGVDLEGVAGARVYMMDSQVINNSQGGFFMQGAAGATNNAVIERTQFDLNGGAAVATAGPGQVVLSANTLAYSNPSVQVGGGATVVSYSNNVFRNAATGVTTTPLQ